MGGRLPRIVPGLIPGTGPRWLSPWAIRSSPHPAPPEGRGQSWRCPVGSRVPRIAPRGGIQQTRKKETYRSRDASGYGSGSSNGKRRSILSESCRDIRQPRVPGEKGPGPISSEYLLRDRPGTGEADQFHPGSQKRIFSVIQEVLALGGMGLPSRVDGEQTLLNTFSCRYMNSLPCGVKVNEPGASSVPRNLQTPPTYKRPPQRSLDARSSARTITYAEARDPAPQPRYEGPKTRADIHSGALQPAPEQALMHSIPGAPGGDTPTCPVSGRGGEVRRLPTGIAGRGGGSRQARITPHYAPIDHKPYLKRPNTHSSPGIKEADINRMMLYIR